MNKANFIITKDFTEYKKAFLETNKLLNLISKNDEQYLWEKHIYDSLAIKLFFQKYNIQKPRILDIGCGGGFPCVPIAIEYPNIEIIGVDSIAKKINAVANMCNKLNINNLSLVCDRVENLTQENFNIIVSRAVAKLAKLVEYAIPLLEKDGYFIAYKSKKASSEIKEATLLLNKYRAKIVDTIEYTLPLDEIYERNLIVIQRY